MMSPFIHLIWGPTTTGKTAHAVALAERTGSPVISLDRIQCCPDLAIGSGRPKEIELKGTVRQYLVDRSLSCGIISAVEANELLKEHVATYGAMFDEIILEGGSVSLLKEMIADDHWKRFHWALKYCGMSSPPIYLAKARERVREMINPAGNRRSLLSELVTLWKYERFHSLLEDIDGYRCAIRFAHKHEILIQELLSLTGSLGAALIDEIADEYFQHALWQTLEFSKIRPPWNDVQNI